MDKKPYYITSAIAYASAKPHIGNTYEIILCDAIARYKRLLGYDVFFQTGTDEHGEKVEEKAKKSGQKPKQFVDNLTGEIQKLWNLADVSYDKFIRTTDDYHEQQVQKIFDYLYKKGDIYKGSYEGWYCTPCESFWTESQLEGGKCPDCGREVKKSTEEAYFFKMSKYVDRLVDYYNTHAEFVLPETRKTEMYNNFIKNGLQDLCVSRCSFSWGVPVDFDKKHIVYVWIDALTNYITGLGYDICGNHSKNFEKFWPADLHVVGKDIIRFHIIYWPIILMALDLPLPKQIYGHGWLLQNGEKMSKSKGNVLYFDDLASVFGVDAVRYYVLSEMGFCDDGLISWELLTEKINADLANNYGNLVSRTCAMAQKYFGGKIENKNVVCDVDESLKQVATSALQKLNKKMDEIKISDALSEIFAVFRRANKYIDETEPWVLAKNGETDRLETVLYNLLETIVIGTNLLAPFMPNTVQKVLEKLNIKSRDYCSLNNFDSHYCFNISEGSIMLFPRFDLKEVLEKGEQIKQEQLKEYNKMIESENKNQENLEQNSKPEIEFEDFEKVELKVGKILSAEKVENADKLLKFLVEIGSEKRTIVSGVAKHYNPEYMVNKNVVVCTNLKPRKIKGIESSGMILYAESDNKLLFITPEQDIESGSEVC